MKGMSYIGLICNGRSVGFLKRKAVPDELISTREVFGRKTEVVNVPEWHVNYTLSPVEFEKTGQELLPFHYTGHKEEELIKALQEHNK